jgi:hypothetical protein
VPSDQVQSPLERERMVAHDRERAAAPRHDDARRVHDEKLR